MYYKNIRDARTNPRVTNPPNFQYFQEEILGTAFRNRLWR